MREEKFRRSLFGGFVISSLGYRIRVLGRAGLEYRDERGVLMIDSEALATSRMTVEVYSRSIPDSPERPKALVLGRLQRAFCSAGWVLEVRDD